MAVRPEYRDYVLEQLAGLGGLTFRPMFGGVGLYSDELFFGLIAQDTLYLRADEHNRADFTARNMAPFQPYADRPLLSLTYYATPAEVLEDPEQLSAWARRSVAAARRAPAPRRRRSRAGPRRTA